ncbi:hypothetical protein OHA02_14770 [Streptomyces phaeochromogenes]|nr:hypothetical protein [Streptomyces phaeochromogenes]
MIRIVTAARLRELRESASRARARTAEVQRLADAALVRHIHRAWELTARTEKAETATSNARWDVDLAQAEAALLREELEAVRRDGRSLVLLVHYGVPHSIHRGREAAEAYAATLGVDRHGWGPLTDRPAREVAWRILGFTAKEGSNDYLAA